MSVPFVANDALEHSAGVWRKQQLARSHGTREEARRFGCHGGASLVNSSAKFLSEATRQAHHMTKGDQQINRTVLCVFK